MQRPLDRNVHRHGVNTTAALFISLMTTWTTSGCTTGDSKALAIPNPPDAQIIAPDAPPTKTCEVPVPNVGSGNHFPGENCMDCHGDVPTNGAPRFTVAGTLYNGPSGNKPVPNATVTIIDANGIVFTLPTQQNGNFYTSAPVVLPVRSSVSQCPKTKPMVGVSTGNCNVAGCHSATGGVGRVYLQVL